MCRAIAFVLFFAACSSADDPTSPTVVPSGASDSAWAAIGKTCTPTSPAFSVPRARLDSAPTTTHGPGRTVDDEWSDVARDTPGGFAGLILESGTPVIFLVDTTRKAEAIAALDAKHIYSSSLANARVRPARWDFMQLAQWFRYLQIEVAFSGLTNGADIDEAKNRISYGVRDAATRTAVEQVLKRLDLPCYLVALESSGDVIVR